MSEDKIVEKAIDILNEIEGKLEDLQTTVKSLEVDLNDVFLSIDDHRDTIEELDSASID